jgi:O-antigen/teichoic acid export membrane protein
MTRGSSFLSKIGVLSLNRVATMIMNFVAVSHIARALESANFGTLMFAIAFVEYFTLAACLGFDNYLPRAVAAQPSSRRRLVGASLVVRVALSCILLPGVLLSLMFLDISAGAKWVIVIVACSMFTSAIGLTSAYQGLQRMNIVAARGFGWSLFNMLGALLFVHNEDDLVSAAIVTVASTSIVNLLVFAL